MPLIWEQPDGHVQVTTITPAAMDHHRHRRYEIDVQSPDGTVTTRALECKGPVRVPDLPDGFTVVETRITWEEPNADVVLRLAPVIQQKSAGALEKATAHLVKSADMPKDGKGRNGWRLKGGKVVAG